jgi:hypothetical protein
MRCDLAHHLPRLQVPSPAVLGSLVPIVGGVALASMTEVSFNWSVLLDNLWLI